MLVLAALSHSGCLPENAEASGPGLRHGDPDENLALLALNEERGDEPAAGRDEEEVPTRLPSDLHADHSPQERDSDRSDEAESDEQNPIALLVDGARERNESHPLRHFFRQLDALVAERGDGQVRILQVGDSHTASDTFTGEARALLQARFGAAGRGYLMPGRPWRSYRQEDVSYNMSGDWRVRSGMRHPTSGPYSLAAIRVETESAEAWLERESCSRCEGRGSFSTLTVFFARQPEGGRFEVLVDGEVHDVVDTASVEAGPGSVTWAFEEGEHTVRLRTLDEGRPVALFGTSTASIRRGITYDSIGLNGAQLRHFLNAEPAYINEEIATLSPDLLVIAFGPNEAFSSRYQVDDPRRDATLLIDRLNNYRDEVRTLVETYREAAAEASCLVLLPPDLRNRDGQACSMFRFDFTGFPAEFCVEPPPYNYPGIISAQRYAAMELGCAVWDQQSAMGGEGSINIWHELDLAAGDGVHLRGSGYDRLAEQFVEDLVRAWEAWRRGDDAPLETTVIFPELATTAITTR